MTIYTHWIVADLAAQVADDERDGYTAEVRRMLLVSGEGCEASQNPGVGFWAVYTRERGEKTGLCLATWRADFGGTKEQGRAALDCAHRFVQQWVDTHPAH